MERSNCSFQRIHKTWLGPLVLFLLFGSIPTLGAQSYRDRFYYAYIHSRMDLWEKLTQDLQKKFDDTDDTTTLRELVLAQYGLIPYKISTKTEKNPGNMEILIRTAEKNIQELIRREPDQGAACGFLAGFLGYKIGINPLSAIVNGPQSADALKKALSLSPRDPFVRQVAAQIEFFTPPLFGGSKERALVLFERAVNTYEAPGGPPTKDWVYVNTLLGLARAYEATGKVTQADRVYRKILALEPAFVWVRDTVYPQFRKKHNREI